jgi:hypothetical protein
VARPPGVKKIAKNTGHTATRKIGGGFWWTKTIDSSAGHPYNNKLKSLIISFIELSCRTATAQGTLQ